MPRAVAASVLALSLFVIETASARCYSNEQCPSWQVCTVSLGACGGDGELDVCTGSCVAGHRLRVVPRLGVGLLERSAGHSAGAVMGLEIVPPLFGGRLSAAMDYWTQSLVRLGVAVTWHALDLVAVGVRLDITRGGGATGAMGAIRIEVSPLPQLPVSVFLEGGASHADARTSPTGSAGIAVWL